MINLAHRHHGQVRRRLRDEHAAGALQEPGDHRRRAPANRAATALPGDPRAFDLLTGKEVWRFHVVPHPGEENDGTWGLNGWQDRRGPGVWVPMSVDPVNDLVFVPLGNATDQNYGNSRPGENLYATTLLALRASTGKRVWHFQLTHHDIYDWDVNSPAVAVRGDEGRQAGARPSRR